MRVIGTKAKRSVEKLSSSVRKPGGWLEIGAEGTLELEWSKIAAPAARAAARMVQAAADSRGARRPGAFLDAFRSTFNMRFTDILG